MLRTGIDPYTALALSIFGVPLDQVTRQQRHVGKTAELGLGYGMGADRFYKTARAGGAEITPELAERAKRVYRYSHPRVCAHWYGADRILHSLYRGEPIGAWGPIRIADRRLYLPNGSFLDYSAIACAGNRDGYVISRGRGPKRLWGGTLVENVVQALARLVLAEAMVQIARKYKIALTVHDEIVLVVPDDEAEAALAFAKEIMCKPPAWAPGLPLEVEGFISQRYMEERTQESCQTMEVMMTEDKLDKPVANIAEDRAMEADMRQDADIMIDEDEDEAENERSFYGLLEDQAFTESFDSLEQAEEWLDSHGFFEEENHDEGFGCRIYTKMYKSGERVAKSDFNEPGDDYNPTFPK